MATAELIGHLKGVLGKVSAYNGKELISRPAWGEISFQEAEFEIKTVLNLSNTLAKMPLEYLPDQAVTNIINAFNDVLPCFQGVDSFTIANGDPSHRSRELSNQFHNCANSIYNQVAVWIPFLAYQKGDVAENIKKLTSVIVEAEQRMAAGVESIESKQKQADDILVKAREAAADAGAAVFTQDFQHEADANRKNSWWWLGGTIAAAFAAFVIAICAYYDDYSQYTTPNSLWPKLTSKMLLLSLCFTVSMWCGRIYKSTRHLSIVNRHRALGLKTFQAFSAAASDLHTKDAVLMETTRSIFGNVPTGLINETGSSETDSNIIQIAGKVMDQTGGK